MKHGELADDDVDEKLFYKICKEKGAIPMTPTKYKSAKEIADEEWTKYNEGKKGVYSMNVKDFAIQAMQAIREQTIQQCREVLLKEVQTYMDEKVIDPKTVENLPELMKGESK